MINSIAAFLVKQWSLHNVITELDKAAYLYGLELLISSFLNILILFGISIALGHPCMFIPYILAFIPLRLSAGGYHARSHLTCILLNSALFLLSSIISLNISKSAAVPASMIESFFSLIIIPLISPISARNKPLTVKKKKVNHRIATALSFLFFVFCIFLFYADLLGTAPCNMFICGQLVVTILAIGGRAVR